MGELVQFAVTGAVDWKVMLVDLNNIRDLSNPPSEIDTDRFYGTPYPDRTYASGYDCGFVDKFGAHHNGTVVSHALYLISQGGELNGCDIQAQGMDVAQRIIMQAWQHLSGNPSESEAYADMMQACVELSYPASVCEEVAKALQAAEMDQPGVCSGTAETAPLCAVRHGRTALTTKASGTPAGTFEVGEEVWLGFAAATGSRKLDFQLLPGNLAIGVWQATTALALERDSATTQVDGTLSARFFTAGTEGSYQVLVDGNRDGHYQPWADTLLAIVVTPATTAVGGTGALVTGLDPVRPNPTRGTTTVTFRLAQRQSVELVVYDVSGRRIRQLDSGAKEPGVHHAQWDGRSDAGSEVRAGVYFVALNGAGVHQRRALLRLR